MTHTLRTIAAAPKLAPPSQREAAASCTAVPTPRRVALVGAGRIADTHAEVLKELPGVELTAVVDPVATRAQALARKWGVPTVYADLDEALRSGSFEAAHVLVPPPLHRPVAEACLAAGIDVLLEKPMAESDEDCEALQRAAAASGAALHINQNFVFHPAQEELLRIRDSGSLGRLRHVSCRFNMPLAQMQARQFTHWMFREPKNLLLEQAVHPLSQIEDLVGPVLDLSFSLPPARTIDGLELQTTWLASLVCERGTAQLFFSLGQTFPVHSIDAVFDDGTVFADCLRNIVLRQRATEWIDFADHLAGAASNIRQVARQARRNVAAYALSTLKLKPRSDPFYRSMRSSIAAFHGSLGSGPVPDGAQGRRLVALCERMAREAGLAAPPTRAPRTAPEAADVLVIGGTGFIGRAVVAELLRCGKTVSVLARNATGLPPLFDDPRVGVIRGDATDPAALAAAMARVRKVVALAHAGGASDWESIERSMVGGAETLARCCLEAGVERLVYVSTIAALYLGAPGETITGDTPPDPRAERRGHYSRAKAAAEQVLGATHRDRGLNLTILRPGVVVGEGSSPFHSGIGFYNREQHCLGWNKGDNELPLVLVEDTASAIALALDSEAAAGRTYNVIGDVRLTAREYTAALARALGRPLRYHPQTVAKQQAIELFKWVVKRASGRRDPAPGVADLRSRGLLAVFDTSDIKSELGWRPVADRDEFLARAIAVHGEV